MVVRNINHFLKTKMSQLLVGQWNSLAISILVVTFWCLLFKKYFGSKHYPWLAYMGVTFVIRGIVLKTISNQKTPEKLANLENLYALAMLLNGIGWGSSAFFFYDDGNVSEKVMLYVFILAIISAGLTRCFASFRAGAAFAIGILGTAIMHELFSKSGIEGSSPLVGATAMSVYLGYMLITARQNYKFFVENYTLNQEKAENIKNLERTIDLEKELKDQKMISTHSAKMAALGEMAGNIAHEINNPLAIIKINTESIIRKIKKDNEEHSSLKNLDKVLATTDRIAMVVKNLREFSHENFDEEKEEFELKKLLEDIQFLTVERMKTLGIEFRCEGDFSNIVPMKKVAMTQVLLNLINNAIHEITDTDNPWIMLKVEKDFNSIIISVRDSGIGVPEHLVEKIFKPYFTTKEVGEGTGIGLSISKKLIEDMGGNLHLDNEDRSCFIIRIPLAQSAAA